MTPSFVNLVPADTPAGMGLELLKSALTLDGESGPGLPNLPVVGVPGLVPNMAVRGVPGLRASGLPVRPGLAAKVEAPAAVRGMEIVLRPPPVEVFRVEAVGGDSRFSSGGGT